MCKPTKLTYRTNKGIAHSWVTLLFRDASA